MIMFSDELSKIIVLEGGVCMDFEPKTRFPKFGAIQSSSPNGNG